MRRKPIVTPLVAALVRPLFEDFSGDRLRVLADAIEEEHPGRMLARQWAHELRQRAYHQRPWDEAPWTGVIITVEYTPKGRGSWVAAARWTWDTGPGGWPLWKSAELALLRTLSLVAVTSPVKAILAPTEAQILAVKIYQERVAHLQGRMCEEYWRLRAMLDAGPAEAANE